MTTLKTAARETKIELEIGMLGFKLNALIIYAERRESRYCTYIPISYVPGLSFSEVCSLFHRSHSDIRWLGYLSRQHVTLNTDN